MKKRTLILLVVVVLFSFSLVGCGDTVANETDEASLEMSNFKTIDGKDYLVYDLDTQVVYYIFSTSSCAGYQGFGYGYFAPYISKNGKFCRYVNDEIVEITVENTNN